MSGFEVSVRWQEGLGEACASPAQHSTARHSVCYIKYPVLHDDANCRLMEASGVHLQRAMANEMLTGLDIVNAFSTFSIFNLQRFFIVT